MKIYIVRLTYVQSPPPPPIQLFNPPYVPTPPGEVGAGGLAASWAGGEGGRQVIDAFLPRVPALLSGRGAFYLVTISQNDPPAVAATMTRLGLDADVALVRDADEEKLTILRARLRAPGAPQAGAPPTLPPPSSSASS